MVPRDHETTLTMSAPFADDYGLLSFMPQSASDIKSHEERC